MLSLSISSITNLQNNLTQANLTIAQQKAKISNLTNILNFNKSQVIFNKTIFIGTSNPMSTSEILNSSYYPFVANTTLHFNFTHAGYIVVNSTGQKNILLILMQNYSRTLFGLNDSGVLGNLNFTVRSLTMPVLPGPATLRVYYYNTTTPYEARFTIIYHS